MYTENSIHELLKYNFYVLYNIQIYIKKNRKIKKLIFYYNFLLERFSYIIVSYIIIYFKFYNIEIKIFHIFFTKYFYDILLFYHFQMIQSLKFIQNFHFLNFNKKYFEIQLFSFSHCISNFFQHIYNNSIIFNSISRFQSIAKNNFN